MKREAVIVLDCGATNLRAIAVDRDCNILAAKSFTNYTSPDPYYNTGRIWDSDRINNKLSEACMHVCKQLDNYNISGVCTTSFGVDGAPYDENGKQLYPVISWACERTKDIVDELHEVMPLADLHGITGLNHYHFNTLYKLFWLRKHRGDILDRTHHWLFMPAIISGFLCGEAYTDISMLGTSMLCDRSKRDLSEEILSCFGIKEEWFPALQEAGEHVGLVSETASVQTGLPEGAPVFAAGHDTQFAIYDSGAGINEPILSSGTWEILMVRTPEVNVGQITMESGITTELDAIPGLYNPGIQWLGSKHVEELKRKKFSDLSSRMDVYDIMIDEARKFKSGRGRLFRKILEELSEKTKESLLLLEEACGFKAESLIVVGGGSKNKLWNELREEFLGIRVIPVHQSESTVLGAAKIVFENVKSNIENRQF